MKGKLVYFSGEKKFGITEHELPEASEGAVLVKIICTNICGSDVKNWKGASSVGLSDKPTCQGHEFIGEIYQLGEGVTTDSMGSSVHGGDRVVAPYYITCKNCPMCKIGRYDLCENAYIHLGSSPDQWPYFGGTFASHYYIYPEQEFYKVPDDVPNELAVGANCAFSQVYYGLDRASLVSGETLLIQGAGGLGLYASAIAKEKGAKVIIIDTVSERLETAKKFGADYVINASETTLEEREALVKEYTEGKGPEAALEVTGFAGAFEEGIHHLAIMGRYIVIGINSTGVSAEISPGYITRKAITVYGVCRYLPEYLYKSLRFLEKYQDKYPFKEFSDRSFRLEEIGEALQLSADRKITRAIIRP